VKPLHIALALVAAALVGALGWMTDWGQGFGETDVAAKKIAARADPSTVLPDFKLSGDNNAYALIAEKPLLNPTRRPAPTQPIAVAAPEPPKPQIRRGLYQLVGVSDYGSLKVAQLRELAGGKVRSVRVGDNLQELRVAKIDRTLVTLEFQGETDTLEIAKYTASGRVPQPPAPPMVATITPPPPQPIPQPMPGGITQVTSANEPPQAAVARPAMPDPSTLPPGAIVNQRTGAITLPGQRDVISTGEYARRRLGREPQNQ
jgi:hypothetical protein